MNGKYDIIINSNNITYSFTIKRKITLITGDSGEGKTYLLSLLEKPGTSIKIFNSYNEQVKSMFRIIINTNIDDLLEDRYNNKIIFIDESLIYYYKSEIINIMEKSNNYFIIITRSIDIINKRYFERINFSIEEVYCINKIKNRYNKLNNKYNNNLGSYCIRDDYVFITEDSSSSFYFFKNNLTNKVYTAKGRSNIYKVLLGVKPVYDENNNEYFIDSNDNVVVLADGSALGSMIDLIMQAKEIRIGITLLILPECFEWLLLNVVNVYKDTEFYNRLNKPFMFIDTDNKTWCSWESYFINMLVQYTSLKDNNLALYSKSNKYNYYEYFDEVMKLLFKYGNNKNNQTTLFN